MNGTLRIKCYRMLFLEAFNNVAVGRLAARGYAFL